MSGVLIVLGLAIALAIAGAVTAAALLWIATRGDYPVPATVTDDPSLPAWDVLGIRLHAQAFGPEAGPVVIVLHGGPGGDHRSLLPLAALGDDGFRVLFYDQRGAGLSERVPDSALTLSGHLAELDAIASAASPDAPVILIGHSWGAMLASAYLGTTPERVARAVLIEPGFLSARGADAFLARMRRMTRTPALLWTMLVSGVRAQHVRGPDAEASSDFLYGQVVHAFASHPDTPYHCPGETFDSPTWRFGARASRAVLAQASRADLDSLGAVAGFTGPVLLMSGACNDWTGAPLQERHVRLFANARHSEIPGAGHDVVDDRPEAALAALREFLTR
jgi:proline iminopeptidase